MDNTNDMCCCGWTGENFALHHEETRFEDQAHVETSPLMKLLIEGYFQK